MKRRRARRSIGSALLLLFVLGTAVAARAEERILEFASDVTIDRDASMTVRETIRVRAEGEQIRRGIYRDFPTRYRDAWGNAVVVDFDLLETTRDGRPEKSRRESQTNGVRIYLGREEVLLEPGEYSYEIAYRVTREIGFFPDHDELYWNVTGNGWAFPIDRATARVRLPPRVPAERITVEGYTGPEGSKERSLTAAVAADGTARFETTRALGPNEGLTIVVSWPKGFVAEPTREDRLRWFVADNRNAIAGLLGLVVVLVYYGLVWWRVGRDPPPGPLVTRYEPPAGFTPAAVRYLVRMGYDDKTFATAIVGLAVRGELEIREERGAYTLVRRAGGKGAKLAPDEALLLDALFSGGEKLALGTTNGPRIRAAVATLTGKLGDAIDKVHFRRNARYLVPGLVLSTLAVAAIVLAGDSIDRRVIAGFMMVWLSGWTFGITMMLRSNLRLWRAALDADGVRRVMGIVGATFPTLFFLPFLAGEIFGLFILTTMISPAGTVALVLVVIANLVFQRLLPAPTLAGRAVLDQVDGLREFLSRVEGDRIRRLPIERTPQLFETLLPYAMALDVEEAWSEQFADVLAAAGREYVPGWYAGGAFMGAGAAAFAGSLSSSMSTAISSAATPPGSSSGGGGGGSSGGGGGGGGGGGW